MIKKIILLSFLLLLSTQILTAQAPPPIPSEFLSDEPGNVCFPPKETSPFFPGCSEVKDVAMKKKCSEEKMIAFIYENLNYPETAILNKIQGTVYLKFIIEKDGTLSNFKITRDISGGCGEEAIRVLKLMPKWEPSKFHGRPIRMQINLPVKFKLP